jgi:hypothetical protein
LKLRGFEPPRAEAPSLISRRASSSIFIVALLEQRRHVVGPAPGGDRAPCWGVFTSLRRDDRHLDWRPLGWRSEPTNVSLRGGQRFISHGLRLVTGPRRTPHSVAAVEGDGDLLSPPSGVVVFDDETHARVVNSSSSAHPPGLLSFACSTRRESLHPGLRFPRSPEVVKST